MSHMTDKSIWMIMIYIFNCKNEVLCYLTYTVL